MTASIAFPIDRTALAHRHRGSRVEPALIGALFVVTAMAAAGYAVFALHPERLAGAPSAAAVYGQALRVFPPAHIVAGVVVLASSSRDASRRRGFPPPASSTCSASRASCSARRSDFPSGPTATATDSGSSGLTTFPCSSLPVGS